MTTLSAKVADASKLDRLEITFDGDSSAGSVHSVFIERTFVMAPAPAALRAEDYPILAAIWDNEEDAVYDTL
jgi:hypothetical protein